MKITTKVNENLELNSDSIYIKGIGNYDGTNAGTSGVKTSQQSVDNCVFINATYNSTLPAYIVDSVDVIKAACAAGKIVYLVFQVDIEIDYALVLYAGNGPRSKALYDGQIIEIQD